MRGSDIPLRLNPLPEAEAAEMVTLVPPPLVKVIDWLLVEPTVTLPKAALAGFAVSVPCVTPLPETGMVKFGSEPVEVSSTLPLAVPAEAGANFTVKVALWPAFNVIGRDSPLRLKPLPLAEAAEIETLLPPPLFRVTDCVLLWPT